MTVVIGDIVRDIARATKLTLPESRVVVGRILDSIVEGLGQGEDYEIRNFGTFRSRVVSGKVGRHMATGISVALPPMRKVSFKVGKFLKPVTAELSPQSTQSSQGTSMKKKGPDNGEAAKNPVQKKESKPATGGPKAQKTKRAPENGEQNALPGV